MKALLFSLFILQGLAAFGAGEKGGMDSVFKAISSKPSMPAKPAKREKEVPAEPKEVTQQDGNAFIDHLIQENREALEHSNAMTDKALELQEHNQRLQEELDRLKAAQKPTVPRKQTSANSAKSISTEDPSTLVGRDELVQNVFNTIARPGNSQNIPILWGSQGVGKSALVPLIKESIENHKYPMSPYFERKLEGAEIIEITPHMFAKHLDSNQIVQRLNDVFTRLDDGHSSKLTVNSFDAHPNELAHALAADAIEKFLTAQLHRAD